MKPILTSYITVLCLLTLFSPNPALAETATQNTAVVEWNKFADSRTGYEVWQLTAHKEPSETFYFYAQSFTADDRYVIFRSRRDGVWDAYRCDLANGEITRLTFNEDLGRACMHPDGEHMAYISGWTLYKINVHTLEKQAAFDFTNKLPLPPQFRPTFTHDGMYTLVYTRDNDKSACLYRVNLESGDIRKVLETAAGGFGHEQINPKDPNLIAYAPLPDTQNDMTLPMEERPRARLIQVEAGTDIPYLVPPYGFRATHDSWSPLGDRYFFFEKTQPGWTPVSIASIDLHGGDYTRHYTDDKERLGHGTVRMDGAWFISDSQQSFENSLILLNLKDGKTETLCWPNASVNTPARVHVHPNFSTSGNYVIYTSDSGQTDIPQVYVVPVRHIKEAWPSNAASSNSSCQER